MIYHLMPCKLIFKTCFLTSHIMIIMYLLMVCSSVSLWMYNFVLCKWLILLVLCRHFQLPVVLRKRNIVIRHCSIDVQIVWIVQINVRTKNEINTFRQRDMYRRCLLFCTPFSCCIRYLLMNYVYDMNVDCMNTFDYVVYFVACIRKWWYANYKYGSKKSS